MKKLLIISFVLFSVPLIAQLTEQDIRARLDIIHAGKADDVRAELPSLMQQYPDDAGVKYLDAYLTENGDQAVKKYQIIVDQFPKSDWADDALHKVYQYYYAVGLYRTADAKQKQLNEEYPTSIYAKREVTTNEPTPIPLPPPAAVAEETTNEKKPETITPSPAPSSAGGAFAVQVGVYSQQQSAQQQANALTATVGKQATVFSKVSGGKTVYAVAFEGFDDETAARSFGAELKSKYQMDWFLVKR